MSDNLSVNPSGEPPPPEKWVEHGPGWVFFGRDGLRPGWSALLFVAIVLVFRELFAVAASFVMPDVLSIGNGPTSPRVALVFEFASVVVVLLATRIMAHIEGRRLVVYGYA